MSYLTCFADLLRFSCTPSHRTRANTEYIIVIYCVRQQKRSYFALNVNPDQSLSVSLLQLLICWEFFENQFHRKQRPAVFERTDTNTVLSVYSTNLILNNLLRALRLQSMLQRKYYFSP